MAKGIEYSVDSKGYTSSSGIIREQDLGFAKIRMIRQYEGSNPYAGRNRSMSPSWVGELVSPIYHIHQTGSRFRQNNEIAIVWGSAVHQAIKAYHIYRDEYVKRPLPIDTRRRKPRSSEPKPYVEKDDRVRLTENLEILTKYAPDKIEEFRAALRRYHQFHLAYSPRHVTRVEKSFGLEIRLGDKLPAQFKPKKIVSKAVQELFSDDPEYLAILEDSNPAEQSDQDQLVVLQSGMGLKAVKLNGKYDQVIAEDYQGGLAQKVKPIDLKSQYHPGNSNDLLQLNIQWLSLFPHRVDRLSMNNMPEYWGQFYTTRNGEIYQVTSTDPVLTAFYTVQELTWANLATKLKKEEERREEKAPSINPDMFGRDLPPLIIEIGSQRFDLDACIKQAQICQRLSEDLLVEEKVGQVVNIAEPLSDEVIDQIIIDAQAFTAKWRIEHKHELMERKIVAMAEQTGLIDKVTGVRGADKWVEKVARGAAPTPPPLPEPELVQSGQYRFKGF